MRFLTRHQYDALIADAQLLRADSFGPKVYEKPDGRIVKLFRTKRLWSSAMVYPYSLRFKRNSSALRRRGFLCVDVDEVFYCRASRRHGVVYRKLQGQPLDTILNRNDAMSDQAFREYAAFIAQLHASRVYFRSLHPGNVLRLQDGGYGLIDVGDMRFPFKQLSLTRRVRNFAHLLRSPEFQEALKFHEPETFVEAYLDAAMLGKASGKLHLQLMLQFIHPEGKRFRISRPLRHQ